MEEPLVKNDRNHLLHLCAVAYPREPIRSRQEMESTVQSFVDKAHKEGCRVILFPEAFTAQLFTILPSGTDPRDMIRRVADESGRVIEMLARMAKEKDLYIIGGSHPVARKGGLYNVAHIFTPLGEVHTQDKLHTTPRERALWDMEQGEALKIFESPWGKIAVLVCYDIEFPEVARLLSLEGVKVLFVPYNTRDRTGHLRVRLTARARAVENGCYVAIAGNVGSITEPVDLRSYGQAAVFTPCDAGFPHDAVLRESEPGRGTAIFSDLDLSSLDRMREEGSVRPLTDRRADLYTLSPQRPIQRERIE